ARMPAASAVGATAAGRPTFTNGVTLTQAGLRTITATDTVTSSITDSADVNVSAADASQYVLQAPSSATAGQAFSATLTAKDQFRSEARRDRSAAQYRGAAAL